jgi:hypothetical protein
MSKHRRYFGHGFSEKALRDQGLIMKKYFDLLIHMLHENCGTAIDINNRCNLTTFDVIGDLAFAEPFDSLKNLCVHVIYSTLMTAKDPQSCNLG